MGKTVSGAGGRLTLIRINREIRIAEIVAVNTCSRAMGPLVWIGSIIDLG
jgi:hypothetical protein